MKNLTYIFWVVTLSVLTLTSCSKESLEEVDSTELSATIAPIEYSSFELEVLELVNEYRSTQGLPQLLSLDEGSVQAATHNDHMIDAEEVCHDFFGNRYEALVKGADAKAVSENVAFGYSSAEAVVKAWIKSESHRINMEGEHTHFGISIKKGKDGKFYFTNIFVRK